MVSNIFYSLHQSDLLLTSTFENKILLLLPWEKRYIWLITEFFSRWVAAKTQGKRVFVTKYDTCCCSWLSSWFISIIFTLDYHAGLLWTFVALPLLGHVSWNCQFSIISGHESMKRSSNEFSLPPLCNCAPSSLCDNQVTSLTLSLLSLFSDPRARRTQCTDSFRMIHRRYLM